MPSLVQPQSYCQGYWTHLYNTEAISALSYIRFGDPLAFIPLVTTLPAVLGAGVGLEPTTFWL